MINQASTIPPEVWASAINYLAKLLGVPNFVAMYLVAMTGLRAVAEGAGWVADKTKNKFDNKVVRALCNAVNAMAWLAGLFGFGKPKHVKHPVKQG